MPYIKAKSRPAIEKAVDDLFHEIRLQALTDEKPISGYLNFAITSLINKFYPKGKSYDDFNSAVGVLECIKQEFYRRRVGPYENEKAAENGDVY